MFSGRIERDQWHEMRKENLKDKLKGFSSFKIMIAMIMGNCYRRWLFC